VARLAGRLQDAAELLRDVGKALGDPARRQLADTLELASTRLRDSGTQCPGDGLDGSPFDRTA
jgi:hypothetical protein